MTKTFRFVGYSTLNGETRVRYANSKSRKNVLSRNGHVNIEIFDAGEALHPMDLVDLLLNRVEQGVIVGSAETRAVRAEAERLGFIINS